MEPIGFLETSVRNNRYSLRNKPEERSSDRKRDYILICQLTKKKKGRLSKHEANYCHFVLFGLKHFAF
jgi:hypothetical protein